MSVIQKLKVHLLKIPTNYLFLWLFALLTFFLGHILFLGWDFSVYVLNAKYFFSDGNYFEIYRPPLMSVLLGMFSFFGWKAAEYIYIFFTVTLFFYSSLQLARVVKLNKFFYVLFSFNVFIFLFGLREGTELLALALLQLFFAFLLEDKWYAGLFLGLACLTRYPFVILFPLLVFHKQLKKLVLGAGGFTLVFIPWFVYNKIHYGNIFYSIADSYALNVLYRDYVSIPFNGEYFLIVANLLLPLFILGVFLFLKKKDFSREKILLVTFLGILIYSLSTQKADVIRYYIPLTIPFVFFAVYSLQAFTQKQQKWIKRMFIFGTILILITGFVNYPQEHFEDFTQEISPLVGDCALESNVWTRLSYYGVLSKPFPAEDMLAYDISEGYYILYVYNAREPEYMYNQTLMHSFPVVVETEEYILLGEGCHEQEEVTTSYLERLNIRLILVYNYTVSEDPCEILFQGNVLCKNVN